MTRKQILMNVHHTLCNRSITLKNMMLSVLKTNSLKIIKLQHCQFKPVSIGSVVAVFCNFAPLFSSYAVFFR